MKASRKKVLLVDDETFFCFSASIALKKKGYHVTTAENGFKGLQALLAEDDSFDILVTDILMPEKSGIELVDEVNRHGLKIPILVISGFMDEETKQILFEKGIADYLEKPFTPDDLLSRIDRLLALDMDSLTQSTGR